ncbi:MAG: AAA family ATPase, partial [Clostridiales Family XIII bacterium]|nr:AAA family ATPase [Clostridiales Family XIII bacterium]
MIIEKIELNNFRNYKNLAVHFDSRVNLFIGANGQGKTNLLEAISILSMGKSFRTLTDKEMIQFDADYFKVKGWFVDTEIDTESRRDSLLHGNDEMCGMDGASSYAFDDVNYSDDSYYSNDFDIEIRVFKDKKRDKKFFVDGYEKKKHADLLEHAYIVTFSPDDLRIIEDMPDKRRKFIDHELFLIRPSYYKDMATYKKILKNKNLVLKDQAKKKYHNASSHGNSNIFHDTNNNARQNNASNQSAQVNHDLLDVYDEYLATYGSKIMLERYHFVQMLQEIAAPIVSRITDNKENLKIYYEPSYKSEMINAAVAVSVETVANVDATSSEAAINPVKH